LGAILKSISGKDRSKLIYDLSVSSVLSVLLYLYYLLSLLFLRRKGIWVIYCETDV